MNKGVGGGGGILNQVVKVYNKRRFKNTFLKCP